PVAVLGRPVDALDAMAPHERQQPVRKGVAEGRQLEEPALVAGEPAASGDGLSLELVRAARIAPARARLRVEQGPRRSGLRREHRGMRELREALERGSRTSDPRLISENGAYWRVTRHQEERAHPIQEHERRP